MTQNRKTETSFFKIIFFAIIAVIAVSIYPVIKYASIIQTYSFITGFIISLANAFMGYWLNDAALKRRNNVFMAMVFGGMGLRMIITAAVVILLISFSGLESVSLFSSVFFFYVLFMSIEIYYFNKKQNPQRDNLV